MKSSVLRDRKIDKFFSYKIYVFSLLNDSLLLVNKSKENVIGTSLTIHSSLAKLT